MTILSGMPGNRWRWLAALCATAACIGLAVHFIDVGASAGILATSDPWLWVVVIMLSLVTAGLRAARVTALARPSRAWPVVKASFLHNAANAVLPARIGDAALPLALRQYAGLDLMQGLGLLLVVRLSDLAVLAGFALILLGLVDIWAVPTGYRMPISMLGAVLCVSVGAVPYLMRTGGLWAGRAIGRHGQRMANVAARLGRSSGIDLVLLTLVIWLMLGLSAQAAAAAVGLKVDWTLTSLACVAASLAFASPVNGVASIGPFEAAFAGVLTSGGAPVAQAVAAAVVLHLCALIGVGLTAFTAVVPSVSGNRSVPCS